MSLTDAELRDRIEALELIAEEFKKAVKAASDVFQCGELKGLIPLGRSMTQEGPKAAEKEIIRLRQHIKDLESSASTHPSNGVVTDEMVERALYAFSESPYFYWPAAMKRALQAALSPEQKT